MQKSFWVFPMLFNQWFEVMSSNVFRWNDSRENHDTFPSRKTRQNSTLCIVLPPFNNPNPFIHDGKRWPKLHICPWSLLETSPSSWLHRKPMQTGLATVISVQCTSTGGRCAKGKRTEKWQTVCFIAFDCVSWICCYLASVYACSVLCSSSSLRMQIWLFPHSWQSRATTWHGSGPLWSFGFLCFLLSHGGLNDTYCALLRHIQITPVSSTHWFIDRNIAGYVLVAEMYKERSLPTDNKNESRMRRTEKKLKIDCKVSHRVS